MQIRNLSLIISATILMACSNDLKKEESSSHEMVINSAAPVTKEEIAKVIEPIFQDTSGINGFYVGRFEAEKYDASKKPMYSNLINLAIDSVIDRKVFGHSVVAGNSRPFIGKVMNDSKTDLEIEAKEPGDNKYDGMFSFIYRVGKGEIEGSWFANDPKLSVTERKYVLKRRFFKYDPNQELGNEYFGEVYDSYNESSGKSEAITGDAGKFNASAVELKPSDIENMYKRDLEILRNTIFARHGYSFKNRAMRWFFDQEIEWYIPVSSDVSQYLTELEKKNIDLIKIYEKHATNYYDSFGR